MQQTTDNLELFYDCLDNSNNFLYEIYHKPYFELLEMTVQNILCGEIKRDLDDDDKVKLQKIYDTIADVDFSVEDVRKAMQAIVLRGFKEMKIPNGNTTPDTLGIFLSYLISKLNHNKSMSIIDPLCGTGNLLLTISNHLDKKLNLFACDHDVWMTKLTSMTADLLSVNVEVYLQDTMNLSLKNLDCVVFDMPHCIYEENNKSYFPYKAILHYKDMLNDGGCMIGIVENDFFDYDSFNARQAAMEQAFENEKYGQAPIPPSPKKYNLTTVEKNVLKQTFKNDSTENRLTRLENAMFGTQFDSDDTETRINRISSAYNAQKSATKYDSNRFAQNMTTAMQIGTILLMVLACIL